MFQAKVVPKKIVSG